MNTSFFGDMLQTIAERGRALIERTRDRREVAEQRSASLVQLCDELLSGRGEASGRRARPRDSVALRRAQDRLPHRLLRGAGQGLRSRPRPAQRGHLGLARDSPTDAAAAEVHRASEPRRLELFRRLNLAPERHRCAGAHARAAARRHGAPRRPRRHRQRLRPPVLVLVQPRLPGAAQHRLVDARQPAREDHPLRGGARDPGLERSARAASICPTGAATRSSIRRWSTSR